MIVDSRAYHATDKYSEYINCVNQAALQFCLALQMDSMSQGRLCRGIHRVYSSWCMNCNNILAN